MGKKRKFFNFGQILFYRMSKKKVGDSCASFA